MLLTKQVAKVWSSKNFRKYVNLGYEFTGYGNIVKVSIDHIGKFDKSQVEVLCDYCLEQGIKTIVPKYYENYLKERLKVAKDACGNCKQKKYHELNLIKQKQGILKKSDKGYYSFKENRLKELDILIKKYENIDTLKRNKEGKRFLDILQNHHDTLTDLVIELGYDVDDIMKIKPNGFYHDFDNFSYSIKKIIDRIGRFPTSVELKNELSIDNRYIMHHGGMYEIKRKMNYNDKEDLVDKRGFFNNSVYELIVANFLIENNISYLREQFIHPDYNFRSDFSFIKEDNTMVHVEVWGYLKTNSSKIAIEYNLVREEKEKIYNQAKIDFVSIEPNIFYKMNYDTIQSSLKEIFEPTLNTELKTFDHELFLIPSQCTDDEIYNIVMGYADNSDYLPEATILRKNNQTGLYNQILKRYKNYTDFADKYNKKVKYKSNGFWTKQKIYEVFDYMIEKYGKILSRNEAKIIRNDDEVILGYYKVCASFDKTHNGLLNLKLGYYLEKENLFDIPESDLSWIKRAEINKSRRGNVPYTPEQQEQAKQILEKYNSRQLTPTT